jgi:hypothetical protein
MSELFIEKQDHIVCNQKIGVGLSGKSCRQENEYCSSTMVLAPKQWEHDALPKAKAGRPLSCPLTFLKYRVQELWSYTSTPPYVFITWCLIKDGDNFISNLNLPLKIERNEARHVSKKYINIIYRTQIEACVLRCLIYNAVLTCPYTHTQNNIVVQVRREQSSMIFA